MFQPRQCLRLSFPDLLRREAPSRISTVTYGSDRPVYTDKSEISRARNRRVHFLVREP